MNRVFIPEEKNDIVTHPVRNMETFTMETNPQFCRVLLAGDNDAVEDSGMLRRGS